LCREKVNLIGTIGFGDFRGDFSGLGHCVVIQHDAATDRARHFATRGGDAAKVLRGVVVSDEIDGLTVWREVWGGGHAVE
jgi:hypothetical protein